MSIQINRSGDNLEVVFDAGNSGVEIETIVCKETGNKGALEGLVGDKAERSVFIMFKRTEIDVHHLPPGR